MGLANEQRVVGHSYCRHTDRATPRVGLRARSCALRQADGGSIDEWPRRWLYSSVRLLTKLNEITTGEVNDVTIVPLLEIHNAAFPYLSSSIYTLLVLKINVTLPQLNDMIDQDWM